MAKLKVPPKKYLEGLGWIASNVDCSWLDAETVAPSIELCLLADLFNVELDEAVVHLRSVVEAVAALTDKAPPNVQDNHGALAAEGTDG
jgi:hypothetical protein